MLTVLLTNKPANRTTLRYSLLLHTQHTHKRESHPHDRIAWHIYVTRRAKEQPIDQNWESASRCVATSVDRDVDVDFNGSDCDCDSACASFYLKFPFTISLASTYLYGSPLNLTFDIFPLRQREVIFIGLFVCLFCRMARLHCSPLFPETAPSMSADKGILVSTYILWFPIFSYLFLVLFTNKEIRFHLSVSLCNTCGNYRKLIKMRLDRKLSGESVNKHLLKLTHP